MPLPTKSIARANLALFAYKTFVYDISAPSTDLQCIGLGIAGEAGEVADEIKKVKYHGKTLDWDVLDKEVGDVLWYIQCYANLRGTTIPQLINKNMEKLEKRYPQGFVPGGGIR